MYELLGEACGDAATNNFADYNKENENSESNAKALEKLLRQETRHVAECDVCGKDLTTDELEANEFAKCLVKDGWTTKVVDGTLGLVCPDCSAEDMEDKE